jgi:hypothetical protein
VWSRCMLSALKPDPQLVYEAERITNAANVHGIRMALKWYEHWCAVGNEAVAEDSADSLRQRFARLGRISDQSEMGLLNILQPLALTSR